ncbi:MAG TPA: DUF4838 domain-containing protein [Candidatus Latescibacteria bacterium]|nr:DUF4838 domain-containing protein [Candidatus Latescibacterota bacterium]
MVLSSHGRTNYVIVLSSQASRSEMHAATELQRFLEEMTGAHFPLLDDGVPVAEKEIAVGAGRHTEALLPGVDFGAFGSEELLVKTVGKRIVIAGGRQRGTLYGVYRFLEILGCRWFTAKVSRIPRVEALTVEPLDTREKPLLEYREPFFAEAFDGDWAARNLANSNSASLMARHGGKVRYGTFVHTFETLLPVAKYFDEHPEWYSEIDGKRISERPQLCLTNPQVLEKVIEGVRGWIKAMPDATIFSVSQNDWTNPCQCAKCREIDEREGTPQGSILQFVNKVAEAIEDEAPHVAIDTLAYWYSRKPPKTLKPRQNVIIRLCSIECCFAHPLESECPENQKFAEDIREWSRIANRLYVWDYVTNFHNYIMPWPNSKVLGANVRFFARHNVVGLFEQGSYAPGGGGEAAEMRAYVLAKLLWNPSVDENRIRDEFIDGVYGKAAGKVREYVRVIHEPVADPNIHMHIFCDITNPHLTDDVIERGDALLYEAEALAESEAVRERVELAHLPMHYVRIRKMTDVPEKAEERKALLERFLAIARREGIRNISEQHTIETWAQHGAIEPGKW